MDEYSSLRKLLVGDQQQQLAHLEQRLNNPAQRCQEVSEILPDALQVSNPAKLTTALRSSITQVVQTDPKPFAKAIFPVMMPSVRQTIAEAFKSLREFLSAQENRLNELTKHVFLIDKQFLPTFQSELQILKTDLEQSKELLKKQEDIIKLLVNRFSNVDKQILPTLQSHLQTIETHLQQQLSTLNSRLQKTEEIQTRFLAVENDLQQLPIFSSRLEQLENTRERFLALEHRLNNAELRTQELASFLPDAIRQASEQAHLVAMEAMKQQAEEQSQTLSFEPNLTESLQDPVTQCIKKSIQEDASVFANALFPVMGPAIRKSINESLKSLIQSINHSIEQSLSPKGIAWRFEAIRTGQSFTDIVLQKTVIYQVDQVFLIHKESGLLIQHLHREDIEVGDSDAVSGMLTAIQDFTRDSFSTSKDEELDSVNIGQFTVWLERGPYAVLACVIRGVASYKLRETMRGMLEIIHARYGHYLEHFNGDPTTLEGCRSLLNKTLQAELKPEAKKEKKRLFSSTFIIICLFCLGFLGWWGFNVWESTYLQKQRFELYLETLHRAQGLVIVDSKIENNILKIRGLRDPLASNPLQIAQQQQLDLNSIQAEWSPYQALTPEFILKRLELALSPPPTVQIYLQGKQLVIKGYASTDWMNQFDQYSRLWFGALEIDRRLLLERDAFLLQQLQSSLKLPSTVQLKIKNTVVMLSGYASQEWIEYALSEMQKNKDIQEVIKDSLLETDQYLQQQAVKILSPPTQVSLQVKNAVLIIQGKVKTKDYQALIEKTKQLQGFDKIESAGLIDIELEIEKLIEKIEKQRLYFSDNADFSNAEQSVALNMLAKDFQQTLAYARQLNKTIWVKIIGQTDGLGTQRRNLQLSELRAETIRAQLQNLGIPAQHLTIGMLEKVPFGESKIDLEKRAVAFIVVEKLLP
jgi:outer membrane protein OmpA-like peptidoglycan-associated protein